MTDRPKRPPDTAAEHRRATQWKLTEEDRAAIRAAVAKLPPLTDEQVDALCEIIIAARKRRERQANTRP
jgi:hypothetical protein